MVYTDLLYHHAKFGALGFRTPPEDEKVRCFLFFSFFMPWNNNVCALDFAMKALDDRNGFDNVR